MIALYTAYAMPAVRTVVTLSTEGVEDNLVARLAALLHSPAPWQE